MACPKALKSNFSLFCFIVISPNYIVYFIFLSRYDYTQHIIDWNRAYHILDIIRLSEYNYTGNICLVPKRQRNGEFLKDEYRYFVAKIAYRAFQNWGICGWYQKTRKNLLIWERNNIKCRYNKQTNKPYNNCKWCGCFLCSKIIFVR